MYQAIVERIKPPGTVCLEGQPCAVAVPQAVEVSEERSPASLYIAGCSACHDAGVNAAPKIGDRSAWRTRRRQGMDVLYQRAIEGFNAMPPRGVCVGCSDAQVRAAVDYLLEKSR